MAAGAASRECVAASPADCSRRLVGTVSDTPNPSNRRNPSMDRIRAFYAADTKLRGLAEIAWEMWRRRFSRAPRQEAAVTNGVKQFDRGPSSDLSRVLQEAQFPARNTSGWLRYHGAKDGVRIIIPPYETMRPGDVVTLLWVAHDDLWLGGRNIPGTEFADEKRVTRQDIANGIEFLVGPYQAKVRPILKSQKLWGAARVFYMVTRNRGIFCGPESTVRINLFEDPDLE